MTSKARAFSALLGQDNKIAETALSETVPLGKVKSYTAPENLPLSGNEAGDQAFVQESNRLYIWSGTGWYSIALINEAPAFTDSGAPEANYVLDSNGGTPLVITLEAQDPELIGIQWSYEASDSAANFATIQQADNVFTVTAKPQATIEQNHPSGGTFSITFRASDGVNVVPAISSFTISISVGNTYGANVEFPKKFTDSPSLENQLQYGNYDGDIEINYDGTAIVTGTGGSNPVPGNATYFGDGGLAFLYKVNGTWVRTANGQHTNYYSTSGDAYYGLFGGVGISHNGKKALSVTSAYRLTNKHGTWYRYYYDYLTNQPSDGQGTGSVTFTTISTYPSTQNKTNNTYILSPFVKEIGSQYSYALAASPSSLRSSSNFVGTLFILKCDENSTSDGFSFTQRFENPTTANYKHGQGGGAVSYQGDRILYVSGNNRFNYVVSGSPISTPSSVAGISASNVSSASTSARFRYRFDVNRKCYFAAGPKIAIFDLSAGVASDLDTYEEIDLTTLLAVSPSDSTALTWDYTAIEGFSVSYNGDYIMILNAPARRIYVLYNNNGTWIVNDEFIAPSGSFERAAMSGDASTIVGRTNNNNIYVYDAE